MQFWVRALAQLVLEEKFSTLWKSHDCNCFYEVLLSLCYLLSRLYRSLENYDVVRGIFGGKVGTKSITCAALQAEANTDYAEAVKLYNEVKNFFLPIIVMRITICHYVLFDCFL